jgi:hypothetical protein
MIESKGRGVLDAPLSPSMTALCVVASSPLDAPPDCRARHVVRVPPHLHAQYRGIVA